MISPQIPADEKQRLAALHSYRILDSAPESDFDEVVELASSICESPISLVTLIDSDRQWFKSQKGIDGSETPREHAFCAHAIHDEDLMIVPDAWQDERFFDNPYVTSDPNVRFYAGMPIVTAEGYKLGTLCVIDRQPKQLSDYQRMALKVLGHQVMKLLDLRKANLELERRNEINKRLLSIIGHDLKSPINTIFQLVELSEKYDMSIEEFKSWLPKVRMMIHSTNVLLWNLLNWASANMGGITLKNEHVNLRDVAEKIREGNIESFAIKNNEMVNAIPGESTAFGNKSKMEFVMRNLVMNANKFTEGGIIRLSAVDQGDSVRIAVSDTGTGIKPEHRENLFSWKNRSSSDGTQGEKGSGLGLPMCNDFILSMGGAIAVNSAVGEGSVFSFILPKEGQEEDEE